VEGRLGSELIVPSVQWLIGDDQVRASQLSARANPEAIAARVASREAYTRLGAGGARQLSARVYPGVVAEVPSALPRLGAGQRVTGYLSDRAAQVYLGHGKRAVVLSSTLIAAPTASGAHRAIDLSLRSSGEGYQAVASPAPARIPSSLSTGVGLADSGLALIPVDGSGTPLQGNGELDHASVLYANTQKDADTVAKATPSGFEVFTLLRSVDSPQQLSYRLQRGVDRVRLKKGRSGAVEVLSDGQPVATVPAPLAEDAAGTPVPVSVSVSGDTLKLSVSHRSGDYQYPIAIDPSIEDKKLKFEYEGGDWGFETSTPANFHASESAGALVDTATSGQGTWGLFRYATQGESHIYKLVAESSMSVSAGHANSVFKFLHNVGGVPTVEVYPGTETKVEHEYVGAYGNTAIELCNTTTCATSGGAAENAVIYETVLPVEGGGTFTANLSKAAVWITQANGPAAAFNTTSTTISGYTNVLHTGGGWLGPNRGVFEPQGTDPGIGVSSYTLSSPQEAGWGATETTYCEGVQCPPSVSDFMTYNRYSGKYLPNGEPTVEFKVKNGMGSSATTSTKVKVDSAVPYEFTLTGLPPNLEIGDGLYHLKASAKDGSGTTVSSGIASLVLKVDGVQFGTPKGSCSTGPCTASGEWTVSGSEFAVGQHEVTVTATDNAANVAVEKYTMYVARPTSPLPVGPGTVEPQSGELGLSRTDVSMSAPAGDLTFSRTYGSMHLTAGAEGPLGPQWQMNLGGGQNITKLANGDALLTDGSGLQAVYVSEGAGKFKAPNGDQGLTLSEQTVESKVQYVLTDGTGAKTIFALVSGGSSNVWMQSTREEPNGQGSTAITYQSVSGVIEPTKVLAPVPAGVTCGAELKRGCRALTFNYAASTTATGETPAGWGDYVGRLTRVYFTAWDPEGAKMTTTAVAQYAYDTQGRLRAEWDPRISPALKTTYGYDSTGRVIAVSDPGQQPWLFTHGTIQYDTRPGRLLSVTRPSASTAFGNGNTPSNTAVPSISGTVGVGNTLTATTGTWSNSPLAYSYQWQNCNSSGAECKAITGAVNPTYTVLPSSFGHKIVVQVTAMNIAGATSASSTATAMVAAPTYYFYAFGSEGSGNGQFKGPGGVAVDGSGNIWVADSGNNRIEKFEAPGKFLASYTTSGTHALKNPTGIAINPANGKVYVSDTDHNRVVVLDKEGNYSAEFGSEGTTGGKFKGPAGISISTNDNAIYVVDNGNNRVESFNLSTNAYVSTYGSTGSGLGQFKSPNGISANQLENKQIIGDTGNNRAEEYVPGGFCNIACVSFGTSGSGEGQFSSPWGVVQNGLSGKMFVVDSGNNRVEEWGIGLGGTYKKQFGSLGSGYFGQFKSPKWIAEATNGTYYDSLYVSDTGNNRIVLASPHVVVPDPPMTAPSPPSYGTSAVTTLEYRVPVTGAGAPYALGSTETAEWGETAAPVEGTAIFPPDEPEGWPAQDYKRASITYLDSIGREVNSAEPGGAISTAEYNSYNEVVRTLSPANREAALKEGASSAEVSKKLDTQTTYSEGGEAGLEITSTLGPQHKVKLSSGSEVEARAHTQYYYDEGAPSEGGPYRLATKVTVSALTSGKDEDTRTTTTSYGGQEGLGWKLHAPTSATVDPGGLNLVQRTIYDPNTGNVIESRSPGGSGEGAPPVSSKQFGGLGSAVGKFDHPEADAIDAKGNVWVADANNNRIQKFNANGGEAVAYGSVGSGNGQFKHPGGIAVNQKTGNVYVVDTNNHRVQELNEKGEYITKWGTEGGAEPSKFKYPSHVAIDASGNVFVSDSGNNRVEEFNSEGGYLGTFGSLGSGNGQFKTPGGLAFAYGNLYVVDWGSNRVQQFKFKEGTAEFVRAFGSTGTGHGQFKEPWGIASDPGTGNLFVADGGTSNRMEEFGPAGEYLNEFGTYGTGEGHFWGPASAAVDTTGNIYVVDEFNARIDVWTQQSARDTQTIYYTAGVNGIVSACGEHPEWEGLLCETRPAQQPETGGVPNLPVTTVTYNMWAEPVSTVDTVGATTRTSTATYDGAGRLLTKSVTSSVGTALPTVKYEYNSETGELTKQSTTTEGTTKTLTTVLNSLGQLTSSTDADGNNSTVGYDVDGRQVETSDGKGSQTYTYDSTTGFLTKLVDSAAGTFTGTYDVEGTLTTEGYPNGMNVKHALNAAGEETALEYIKTTHCTEKCTWYSDAVTPSIAGQWLSQASTLSSQAYTYDNAGRLTKVQDTPAGSGCTTRIYAYDVETNRVSQTNRNPGGGGACATEGGTVEAHTYDVASRLLDAGISYNTFGNITKLPAADAGGSELTSTYYVDSTLATQTQGGQTIGYNLDPAGRPRETVYTGTKNTTVISHYANGNDETPAWTVDTGGKWTRLIPSIGGFAATQYNGEAAVLQVQNLHGDVVATAPISETATGLTTTNDTTEFGVPRTGSPPQYSWLGGDQKSTELASGVVAMGARSYVPQIGRFLQTDPVAGGSANAYAYAYGDPVGESDPSGQFVPGWFEGAGDVIAKEVLEAEAAREAAAAAAALAAAEAANAPVGADDGDYSDDGGPIASAAFVYDCNGHGSPPPGSCKKGKAHKKGKKGGKGGGGIKSHLPTKKKKGCNPGEYKDKLGHCEKGPKVKKKRPPPQPAPAPSSPPDPGKLPLTP